MLEAILLPLSFLLALTGIYLNLCFLRSTHRSTVYHRFTCRHLRFLSLIQICFACSNIVFTAAMLGSGQNRTPKSEAFFSKTLSVTHAVPAATILWVTVERILYNRIAVVRDSPPFRYLAILRLATILGSILMETALNGYFERTEYYENIRANSTESENSEDVEPEKDYIYLKNSYIANFYIDWAHAAMLVLSVIVVFLICYKAKDSIKRAQLMGGMRNDQKILNLKQQLLFFKRSWTPLFLACSVDFLVILLVKRVLGLEERTTETLYITARSLLPIIFPLSLISLHTNLRIDFLGNIVLCRKARNLHKESKVKVIATRESQESILANLKMIGILSDVDNSQPGAMLAGMGGAKAKTPIAKDPSSTASVASLQKKSVVTAPGGPMMFHVRQKTSLPTMGSVG